MRLVVGRNVLLRALAHITGIVERRNTIDRWKTIPMFNNVLLSADQQGNFTLRATDLDLEAIVTVPAQIAEPGAITITAHILHDIVRKLAEGSEINIAHRLYNGFVMLASGRSSFELAALPANDFPTMGPVDLPHSFVVPAPELKRLLERARFAISSEETRHYLNGIYLHSNGTGLRAVATDGHRLAQIDAPNITTGASIPPGVIIPKKAVVEIIKLLDNDQAEVAVSLSPAKIKFVTGAITLTSKLIDGTFPDYAKVIPTANNNSLQVVSADLVKAVDRVSTLYSEKGRAVKLQIDREQLVISAATQETGSASEELPVNYSDSPIEVGFNARYLIDIAAQISGPHMTMLFAETSSPTLIKDEGDEHLLYVLMPMRV